MAATTDVIPDNTIRVLDHGFVRLDGVMASDLSVVNGARVSFARHKDEMDESDEGLIRFLMRDRHGTPFEHNSFRFHIRCPIFVAREWMRHRVGCLTGDTLVTFVGSNGHSSPQRRKTIDELWQLWTRGERDGHAFTANQRRQVDRMAAEGKSIRAITRELNVARRRVRRLRLRVLNESTNEFETGHITDIVDKGVQPVYRLTLADGRNLTLTENHRILTSAGWATMREAVGLAGEGESAVMTRGCELITNGVLAHRDREWLLEFALRLREVPERTGWKMTGHPVAVERVDYLGLRQTYDLCVEGPWHNFVANGVVVHNSFNEFSMRYAKATDDFYVPEPDDVRTQVGKPGAYSFEPVDPEVADQAREELRAVYDAAFAAYERLVDLGVARGLARCVIPVGAYTEFYWTINARSLMNFVSLRAAETAQREIRRYAEAVERFFAEHMPVTHAAFVANDRVAP
jgi:thymidylate synthase ThyX